ncbi:MAG: phosphatidylserine/phosphatidylglycerophosphate/cardiolipin synthase family protein [Halobacteriales archaeon]
MAPAPADTTTATEDGSIELVEVYPNPLRSQDRGEYVALRIAGSRNLSGLTLSDGEATVRLSPVVASGRVILAVGRGEPPNGSAGRVLGVTGRLALANSGEILTLRRDGTVIDQVRYGTAPAGERYVRGQSGWSWKPLGATDFPAITIQDVPVEAFVLPDHASVPTRVLGNATERVLLGGYTFASERVTDTLCRVRRDGVTVRVLVDADPVGGMTKTSRDRLDVLVACGVDVEVLGGSSARYAVHHAKYAVVDDRAIVLSENWKPSGTGGRSNRGWGVVVDSDRVADRLAAVFHNDTDWRDTPDWTAARSMDAASEDRTITAERYPTRFETSSMSADSVTVLVAPDNAEPELLRMIRKANETIAVQQVSIKADRFSLVAATIAAARRGVSVRILLSGAWYVREENQAVIDRLDRLADREGLPLSARLVDPGGAFDRSHVKGVIVDVDTVFVGSINWNPHSLRENREIGVILEGDTVGEYYLRVFEHDWRHSGDGLVADVSIPPGFAVVVAAVVLGVSIVFARRLRFDAG